MARIGDNPLKDPLAGNEVLAATDPSTGLDVGLTPLLITQFATLNIGLAAGSTQGAMTGAQSDKLNALPDPAALATNLDELSEIAFPIFIAVPTNGTIVIYQHVLDTPWTAELAYALVSAGSTNISIQKGFVDMPGFDDKPVTVVSTTLTGSGDPALRTLNATNALCLELSGTTGDARNLTLSVKLRATLTP